MGTVRPPTSLAIDTAGRVRDPSCAVRIAVLAITGAIFAALAPGANASHVLCGDVLTADTTLDADLQCAGDGLVLTNGMSLNLNGFTIHGSGSGTGVRIVDAREVTNGRIVSFGAGISARGRSETPVSMSSLYVAYNGVGISLDLDRFDVKVVNSVITRNQRNGIDAGVFVSGFRIQSSLISLNGGDGIACSFGSGGTIENNGIFSNGGYGVFADECVVRLIRNNASYNGNDGLFASEDSGLPQFIQAYYFEGNTANFNGALGIRACALMLFSDHPTGCAPGMTDGGGNAATGNRDPRQCVNIRCSPHPHHP